MIEKSSFKPAWWLRNPHAQTIWAAKCRRRKPLHFTRERLNLPDGDFIDLDWVGESGGTLVLVLHGLAGSSRSRYASGLLQAVERSNGWGVFMCFRGASGEPNHLPQSYHCGETRDFDFVVSVLRSRWPGVKIHVVGYSLGGNVLLKWLGERGSEAPIERAVAVSVPFQLAKAATRMNRGFSRVYQWRLLRQLRAVLKQKIKRKILDFSAMDLDRLNTFWIFDDKYTAPLHGFSDVHDYYHRSSSISYLKNIQVPTLIIQAMDDPFMTPDVIPVMTDLSPSVRLELSAHGGHVGFVSGSFPGRGEYWLDHRVLAFFSGS